MRPDGRFELKAELVGPSNTGNAFRARTRFGIDTCFTAVAVIGSYRILPQVSKGRVGMARANPMSTAGRIS